MEQGSFLLKTRVSLVNSARAWWRILNGFETTDGSLKHAANNLLSGTSEGRSNSWLMLTGGYTGPAVSHHRTGTLCR